MPKPSPIRWLPLLCAIVFAGPVQAQQKPKLVRLAGTISPALASAHRLGHVAGDETVQFSFTLPVRRQAELDEYLRRLYTPGDARYHQYLVTGEFASLFGPTQEQYDAVVAFAESSGLKIVSRYSNRLILDVAGPATTVEKVLGVQMLRFQSPTGRVFHAPDQEPSLPAEVAALVTGIANLDRSLEAAPNIGQRVPQPERTAAPGPAAAYPTGPTKGVAPADIKTAYNLNGLTQDGTGQTVALLELDGFYQSDINAYADQFGLPHGTINIIPPGGVAGFPTAPTTTQPDPGGPQECTLDIEMVKALAPNATINVYEGTDQLTILNKIASDNTSQQVSTSWYHLGIDSDISKTTRDGENTALQQMAAQGQTFYSASGDYGDKVKIGTNSDGTPTLKFGVQDPASQPYLTAVGGTSLTFNPTDGTYQSEMAWTGDSAPGGGSGGGISAVVMLPSYQSRLVAAGSLGSADYRNVPDVSLDADYSGAVPIYDIYESFGYPTLAGKWRQFGGTSAAAPLWAAFTALVNQQRRAANTSTLGFANPTIYFLAYVRPNDFHDMTVGNNGHYPAVAGYDNVTGWGSFNGGALFSDLSRDAAVFHVDGSYTGALANGGQTTPFKRITDALNAAVSSVPTLIYVRGGAYNETFSTSKPVVFVNDGNGKVTFGSGTVH